MLKNRATPICASSYHIETNDFEEDSLFLRDKSVSCSHGLELSQRPTTVIGIAQNRASFKNKSFNKKKVNFDESKEIFAERIPMLEDCKNNEEKSVSVSSLSSLSITNDTIDFIDEGVDLTDRSKMKLEEKEGSPNDSGGAIEEKEVFADVHIRNIIKIFDEQSRPKILPRSQANKPPDIPQKPETRKPIVPPRNVTNRGKLDKSHSTPAYDLVSESDRSEIKETNDATTILKHEYVEIPNEPTEKELAAIIQEEKKEVPPKPPPRICTADNYKPRYPAESPKPKSIVTESKVKKETPQKSQDKEKFYDNCERKFEPKCVSTPINKFKTDPNDIDTNMPIIKNTSTDNQTKVSPTNSVVRAMMGNNKSKSVKKKNSLIASKDLNDFF